MQEKIIRLIQDYLARKITLRTLYNALWNDDKIGYIYEREEVRSSGYNLYWTAISSMWEKEDGEIEEAEVRDRLSRMISAREVVSASGERE